MDPFIHCPHSEVSEERSESGDSVVRMDPAGQGNILFLFGYQ